MTKTWIVQKVVISDAEIFGNDISAIVDPLLWTANIYDDKEILERTIAEFSLHQKMIFAMTMYDSEVQNGGHEQFYYNSTGILWDYARLGFQSVGCDHSFNVINDSVERFPNTPPYDRMKRNAVLSELKLDFSDLDESFLGLEYEDLKLKNLRFIKQNAENFKYSGELVSLNSIFGNVLAIV